MPPQDSALSPISAHPPYAAPSPVPPLTLGKFAASKAIVLQSWALLRQDKEIMWFPVLSFIASIAALIVFGAICFFLTLGGSFENAKEAGPETYLVLFLYYSLMFFVTNFFQAGIYVIAHGRFSGRDLSFSDGIDGAMANIGKIFVWSVISATVGVILKMIADRSRFIGKLVAWILGAAWNIMTYFSLPSLVIGQKSIGDSFKESASVIRKTWGETIIVQLGVGLFFSLLLFLGLALSVGIAYLVPDVFVAFGVFVLFLIYAIVLSVISSTLGSIFKLALYEYATTGRVPAGFSPELVQNAIKSK